MKNLNFQKKDNGKYFLASSAINFASGFVYHKTFLLLKKKKSKIEQIVRIMLQIQHLRIIFMWIPISKLY